MAEVGANHLPGSTGDTHAREGIDSTSAGAGMLSYRMILMVGFLTRPARPLLTMAFPAGYSDRRRTGNANRAVRSPKRHFQEGVV
jgi:hypothetical protein